MLVLSRSTTEPIPELGREMTYQPESEAVSGSVNRDERSPPVQYLMGLDRLRISPMPSFHDYTLR